MLGEIDVMYVLHHDVIYHRYISLPFPLFINPEELIYFQIPKVLYLNPQTQFTITLLLKFIL